MAAYGVSGIPDISSRCLLRGMNLDIPHDENLRCPPDPVMMGAMRPEVDRYRGQLNRRHTAKVTDTAKKIVAFAGLEPSENKNPHQMFYALISEVQSRKLGKANPKDGQSLKASTMKSEKMRKGAP